MKNYEDSPMNNEREIGRKKTWLHSKGITYFDGKTEKSFFFILAVILLLWGLLIKVGLLPG